MARADVIAAPNSIAIQYSGAGTVYPIIANNGHHYLVHVDRINDICYNKSTDGGLSWSAPITVFAGTSQAVACWYDRWSGRVTDKIRIAYQETGGHDILYRDIDTASSDTLGTQTTVFDGASAVGGGSLSIVTRGNGSIVVAGSIDAGSEDGAWSSTDDGATWGDTIADPSEGATQDQYFLLPGWNADTADIMLIFVDASTNGLSVKRYDDSGDAWGETAIIADGSFVDQVATTAYPHVACFVDIANSRNVVVAWTAVDTANADLRMFLIDDTTITEVATNVVLNSGDDQGLVAAGVDTATGDYYVFYGGKSDGAETMNTAINVYYKVSTDDGATWGSETLLSNEVRSTQWIGCTPRFATDFGVAIYVANTASAYLRYSVLIPEGEGDTITGQGWWG